MPCKRCRALESEKAGRVGEGVPVESMHGSRASASGHKGPLQGGSRRGTGEPLLRALVGGRGREMMAFRSACDRVRVERWSPLLCQGRRGEPLVRTCTAAGCWGVERHKRGRPRWSAGEWEVGGRGTTIQAVSDMPRSKHAVRDSAVRDSAVRDGDREGAAASASCCGSVRVAGRRPTGEARLRSRAARRHRRRPPCASAIEGQHSVPLHDWRCVKRRTGDHQPDQNANQCSATCS